MSVVRPPPKNDYTSPAPLPGSLRRPAAAGASATAAAASASIDPAEYLEKAEGEWNERVDKEIVGLAGGLESLVKSFGVVRPSPFLSSARHPVGYRCGPVVFDGPRPALLWRP